MSGIYFSRGAQILRLFCLIQTGTWLIQQGKLMYRFWPPPRASVHRVRRPRALDFGGAPRFVRTGPASKAVRAFLERFGGPPASAMVMERLRGQKLTRSLLFLRELCSLCFELRRQAGQVTCPPAQSESGGGVARPAGRGEGPCQLGVGAKWPDSKRSVW